MSIRKSIDYSEMYAALFFAALSKSFNLFFQQAAGIPGAENASRIPVFLFSKRALTDSRPFLAILRADHSNKGKCSVDSDCHGSTGGLSYFHIQLLYEKNSRVEYSALLYSERQC